VSRNLIYIVALNNRPAKINNSDYSKYSIFSWTKYCEKYGIELFVLNDENLPQFVESHQISSQKFPIWFKEYVYKFAQGYDKIGIVDSDTIVKWNAPNIFNQIDPDKFYGVNDLCDLNWLRESIYHRQHFFPNTKIDYFKYINAGVLFFGRKNLEVFEKLLTLYLNNQSEIDGIKTGGKEQTLLNFVLQSSNVDIELLSPEWNLLSIHKKNMFTNNWQLFPNQFVFDDERTWSHFMKYANVWHFTGFPIEDRVRVMQDVWNLIKTKYT